MAKALKEALAEVASLPEADQETIGRELLVHVEILRRLRSDLERGVHSMDAGLGREVSVDDVTKRAHDRYARR
jgi:hypothetical protein